MFLINWDMTRNNQKIKLKRMILKDVEQIVNKIWWVFYVGFLQ